MISSATFTPLFDAPFDTNIILTTSLAARASRTTNYGWLIRDVNGIDGYRFDTSEAVGGATAPPLLIVEFTVVPEPSTELLCGVALAVASAILLRKSAATKVVAVNGPRSASGENVPLARRDIEECVLRSSTLYGRRSLFTVLPALLQSRRFAQPGPGWRSAPLPRAVWPELPDSPQVLAAVVESVR